MLQNVLDPSMPLPFFMVFVVTAVFFVALMATYFMFTVPIYWFYVIHNSDGAIQLQKKSPPKGQIQHEIFWSTASMFQFSVWSTVVFFAWRSGFFPQLYIQIDSMGWLYFGLSVVVLLLIQDALFYFSHRLLHTRRFGRFHAIHHKSRVPTPFSMYSFHPVEALFHFVRMPLVMLVFPLSPFAILISEGVSNTINAYGHLNYEPKWMRRFKAVYTISAATGVYHNLHHSNGKGNFGFYLRFWDRKMGTYLSETDDLVDELHQQWDS